MNGIISNNPAVRQLLQSWSRAALRPPQAETCLPAGGLRTAVRKVLFKAEGVQFRNNIVTGPGGSQILMIDPSGNFVELFEPKQ